jgi:ATP-binding cassette subfamily B protein
VFDGFCLDVEPGRCVAIVGESGSGKSTLASLLLRLYDPNSGRVLIDGRDLRNLKVASLRRQIGVVLQDSVIFAASLSENIRCGVKATDDEVRAAAHLANADGFISALPDDYATIPAERGLTLSRGQRQRIAIARVALRKTPILVLDEPTTGLDRENKKAVGDAIRNLATDRTTFIITHDSQLAAAADDVIDLDKVRLNTLTEQSSREKTACLTPIGAVTTTSSH